MKNMRLMLGSLTAILLLGGIANAQDPGIRDTVRIPSVNVNAGDKFSLVMNLWNDEAIGASTLGIGWGTSDLFLDSISYVGSRTASTDFPNSKVDNTLHLGLSGFATFFGPPMPAGDGTFATFWFTVAATAADQIIDIDSAFVPPAGPFILIKASDNGDFTPEYVMATVTIGNPSTNTAPVLAPIGPKSVDEGQNLNFLLTATDAEADARFFVALNRPLNSTLVNNGDNTATFDFNPDFTQARSYDVLFFVSDGALNDTEIVTITVNDVNLPPSFTINPNNTAQTINEGAGLASLEATDPENDLLTYNLVSGSLPVGITLNANGTFSGTADFNSSGGYSVNIRVCDAATNCDTTVLAITVNNVNRAPAFTVDANNTSQTINENEGLAAVAALDPDGDGLTYSLLSGALPDGITLNANGTFTGTASFTSTGTYSVNITVCDPGALCDTTVLAITVNNVNRAPVLASIGPKAIQAGDSLNIAVSGTDPDDQLSVTVGAGTLPTGAAFNLNGADNSLGAFSWRPTAGQVGDHFVTFFASDGLLADTEIVTITVTDAPIPDSAFVIPDFMAFTSTVGSSTVQNACAFLSSTTASTFTAQVVVDSQNFVNLVNSSGPANDSVCFSVDPSLLAQGVHFDTIRYIVSGVANNPVDLVVQLTINLAPIPDSILVSPDSLFFTIDSGSGLSAFQTAFISSNNDPLGYTISPVAQVGNFASFNKLAGTTNDSVLVQVNPAFAPGLGTFYETWLVSSGGAVNSPQPIVICMTVNPVIPQDSTIMFLSDSLFVFESSVDSTFIGGDFLIISKNVSGSLFGWTISKFGTIMITGLDTVQVIDSLIPPWVDVAPLTGISNDTAFISVDNQGLAPAKYVCVFRVDADSGVVHTPQFFSVALIVNPATPEGVLGLSDTLFTFSSHVGVPFMGADTLQIFNVLRPNNSFGWTITGLSCWYDPCGSPFGLDTLLCIDTIVPIPIGFNDSGWLTVTPLSGVTPGAVHITVNNEGLQTGRYWCEFRVDADSGVLESPQFFTAELLVNPPPSVDTLFVSTVPGTPGSKVKVPVNFINGGPICRLDIPLTWSSPKIFLDSVSFVGTRLEGFDFLDFTFDNSLRQVRITFRDNGLALPPGEGKIANLYFDIFSGITMGGIVPIDTFESAIEVECFFPIGPFNSPVFFPGGIVIDSSANVICGRVIDTAGNEIPGATAQIWDNFPQGTKFAEQTTDFNGSFKFQQLFVVPYTVYAYADGFYPNTLEDINFGSLGLEVVLTPVSPGTETQESMDFFCNTNTLMGVPLPVGSVVDAFDPDGDHVGSFFVTTAGSYGFMPVYRDDPTTPEDDGADPGDIITFYINGMPAEATGANVWTFDSDRQEVCLNFDGSTDKTICLGLGWSLISWNVDTEFDGVQDLFAPIMQYVDVIRSFEEVALTFDPDLVEFSTLLSADHLHGYFINIESLPQGAQCVELTFTGLQELVSAPISLEVSWNLVSYLPTVELPTASALVSQEGNLRVALGYDNGGLTYDPELIEFSTLKTMRPCFGYWLKVFEASSLFYPGFNSAPIIDDEIIVDAPIGALAKMGIEDRLSPTPISLDIYSNGLALDGRTVSGGAQIEILDQNEILVGYGVTSAGGKLMFTPVYGAESANSRGLIPGDQFTIAVDGQATIETFEFTADGDRFEIRDLTSKELSTLPTEFSLAQNYPNPFNPSTKIKFYLPNSSQIALDIFNILGEKVTTLADGFYEAGENEVTWDARSASGAKVASGIYFYRLRAGSRTLTKSMALMK